MLSLLLPQWTRRALPAFSTSRNRPCSPSPNVASHVQTLQPIVNEAPFFPIFLGSTFTTILQRGPDALCVLGPAGMFVLSLRTEREEGDEVRGHRERVMRTFVRQGGVLQPWAV